MRSVLWQWGPSRTEAKVTVVEKRIGLSRRQGRPHPVLGRFVGNVTPGRRSVLSKAEVHVILLLAETPVRLSLLFHSFEQSRARTRTDAANHQHGQGLLIGTSFFRAGEDQQVFGLPIANEPAN